MVWTVPSAADPAYYLMKANFTAAPSRRRWPLFLKSRGQRALRVLGAEHLRFCVGVEFGRGTGRLGLLQPSAEAAFADSEVLGGFEDASSVLIDHLDGRGSEIRVVGSGHGVGSGEGGEKCSPAPVGTGQPQHTRNQPLSLLRRLHTHLGPNPIRPCTFVPVMTAHAPPPTVATQLLALGRDIKLSHTVFALPFAALGAVLAAVHRGTALRLGEAGLVLLCMVLARTFAMTFNRLADAQLDAQNPRTQNRALVCGRVSRTTAVVTLCVCALGFVTAAGGFSLLYANPWPVFFAPTVLGLLAVYSLTKRFTWACHLVLGVALAASPLAAALAVDPVYLGRPTPWLIAGMVAAWVAGFDVIYALQDVAVDRTQGLFSMPSRLGEENALWASRGLHGLAVAALIAATLTSPHLTTAFAAAATAVGLLLVLEHALVWRSRLNRLHLAFFTVNGIISLLLAAAGVWDALG